MTIYMVYLIVDTFSNNFLAMSEADINRMTVSELREALRLHGADTTGNRSQLLQRLHNIRTGVGRSILTTPYQYF